MFRPPDLLATQVAPTAVVPLGSRGFYVRAEPVLLPSQASDMLAVRIGQLTAWGLTPHKIRGLAGRSLETQPSPILNGLSRRRYAALRLAASRYGGLPRLASYRINGETGELTLLETRPRAAAIAAGEGWPPARGAA